jgi:hypothetical protein
MRTVGVLILSVLIFVFVFGFGRGTSGPLPFPIQIMIPKDAEHGPDGGAQYRIGLVSQITMGKW